MGRAYRVRFGCDCVDHTRTEKVELIKGFTVNEAKTKGELEKLKGRYSRSKNKNPCTAYDNDV